MPRIRSRGQKICFQQKRLATRNTRVKYERPQGIHLCNIKALSPFVKKLSLVMVKVKFTLDRQTDGQTDRVIPIYPHKLRLRGV